MEEPNWQLVGGDRYEGFLLLNRLSLVAVFPVFLEEENFIFLYLRKMYWFLGKQHPMSLNY